VSKKDQKKNLDPTIENRQARFKFQVFETFEAGMVLKGSEVKSIRSSEISLQEGYVHVLRGELLLEGCHISPYKQHSTHTTSESIRSIRLLMHKREIEKVEIEMKLKKLTMVPLKIYFKKGYAKILIGLARGKNAVDKRQDIKKKDIERTLKRHNR
jgi:SsrA-binding protein